MWLSLNELSGLERFIDCSEGMWLAGCIGFILGAVVGSGAYYMLRNWD